MSAPAHLRYTNDHEWACWNADDTVSVGITDYAQSALGDVVYVDLPRIGRALAAHEAFGVVESTKSVSDLFSPLAGTVAAVNAELDVAPETLNKDCYGAGWIMTLSGASRADFDALLDAAAYDALVASLG